MRNWLSWLVRERVHDLALALALGIALAVVAEKLVDLPVRILGQKVGRDPFEATDDAGAIPGLLEAAYAPFFLNFSLGDTVIVYGETLSALLALGLLTVAALLAIRLRDRDLGTCPSCASRIPHEARHCAYCGSSVSPSET